MPTPREERAAARDSRQNLQVPQHGLGRADLIRSRTPSPTAPGTFNFPRPALQPQNNEANNFEDAIENNVKSIMATQEQLDAIREQLRNEIRAEVRNETVAAEAATPDAIKRKPEIPPFDKEHVDIWIKRTENAFIRALITSPRDKFAFLEAKFPCNFNPRINDYLWGDATQDSYDEFIAYLRSEYGPTKQQKAAIFIDGFKRDGRKPSQYIAALNEKTKDVTVDDIKKEMLIREMPMEIRRMLQERLEEGISLEEAAKTADAYFDKDGRPRFQSSSVNEVRHAESEPDEVDGINAVNNRFKKRFNLGPKKPQGNANFSRPTPKPATTPKTNICFYHEKYGEYAKKCNEACKFFDANRFSGNGQAGHKQ